MGIRIYFLYLRDNLRQILSGVYRKLANETIHARLLPPESKLASFIGSFICEIRKINRRRMSKRLPCRSFYLPATCPGNHQYKISLNEIQNAVAFNKNPRRRNALQSLLDSRFDLLISGDHPVNICGAGVPIATGIFTRRIILFPTRTNNRFSTQQIADTAGLGILAA